MKNNSIDYKIKNIPVLMKPYFFAKPSLSAISIKMLVVLMLHVLLLLITKSYSALIVIFASTAGAALASVINYILQKKQPFTIMTVIIQGLLIGMLLPQTYPPVTVFFISFLILLIEKYLFVNCVNSWINVVCLAVILAWFIGRVYFPSFIVTADLFPLKNASAFLIQNGSFPIYGYDTSITEFLNNSVFAWFKVTLPGGFVSLLCDNQCLIPAFRFTLLTLFSSIILFSDGGLSLIIPSIFLFVYAILVRLFFPMISGGVFNSGDMVLALSTSGTIFCSVFLLQWFGTTPVTITGKIVFGILSGITAFLIVGCGTSPIGMVYSVIIANIFNLIIRRIEEHNNSLRTKKLINTDLKREVE